MRGRGTAKCQLSRRFVAISFFSLRVHDTGARYSSRFRSPHCVCARCGGAVLRSASSHAASSQCRSSHCVCTTQGRGTAKCQLPPLRRDIALLTACARYGPSGTRYCKVSAHALLRRNVAPLAACGRHGGAVPQSATSHAASSQCRSSHCACTTRGRGTAKCQLRRRFVAISLSSLRVHDAGTRYYKVPAHMPLRRNVALLTACGRSYTGTWYCKVSAPAPSSQFRSPHCVWAICVRSVVNPGHRAVISEQSAVASARGGVS